MNEKKNALIENIPAAKELRKVPGFDPLRFLRRTVSKTGEKVLKLDLPYKKLWFRLACSNGRMLLNPLRITEQMAIFEARLYASKDDPSPLASFTSTQMARDVPGGLYIRAAQDEALNEVLDNAGFGIQLCDVAQVSDGGGRGSEILLSKMEAAKEVASIAESAVAEPEPPVQEKVSAPQAPKVVETVVQAEAATVTPPPVEEALPPVEEPPVTEELVEVEAPVEETVETETFVEPQSRYTDDMTVEEICQRMTLEEARAIVVPLGTCRGWTLGQVENNRPASLKWYLLDYSKTGNIVKAGATLLLNEIEMKKAG